MNDFIKYKQSCLLANIKQRAKKKGIPFDLKLKDIQPPKYCPILGIELEYGYERSSDRSPSVDRINNNLGYTRDNIVVVSMRANRLKSDASIEELRKIADFYEEYKKSS